MKNGVPISFLSAEARVLDVSPGNPRLIGKNSLALKQFSNQPPPGRTYDSDTRALRQIKRKSALHLFLVAIFGLTITGCGGPKEEVTVKSDPVKESVGPAHVKVVDPATVGTVKGKILFEGQAPAPKEISVKGNPECAVLHPGGEITSEELVVNHGALQNVFIYVKEGLDGYLFPTPQEPVTIQNKNCVYVPHVTGVMAGQPVVFLNQDSTLHNIHSYPKNSKAFNLGLPLVGMKKTKKFDAPELMVPLKCDVHPWMQGYIGVLSHPYFAVSDANGQFELKNLPPGEYTVEAWHEKLGVRSQRVTLGANETKQTEFKYTA